MKRREKLEGREGPSPRDTEIGRKAGDARISEIVKMSAMQVPDCFHSCTQPTRPKFYKICESSQHRRLILKLCFKGELYCLWVRALSDSDCTLQSHFGTKGAFSSVR